MQFRTIEPRRIIPLEMREEPGAVAAANDVLRALKAAAEHQPDRPFVSIGAEPKCETFKAAVIAMEAGLIRIVQTRESADAPHTYAATLLTHDEILAACAE